MEKDGLVECFLLHHDSFSSFMATVFSKGSVSFQHDFTFYHTAKTVQECARSPTEMR